MGTIIPYDIFPHGNKKPVGTIELSCAFNRQNREEHLVSFIENGVIHMMPDENGCSSRFNAATGKEIYEDRSLVRPRKVYPETFQRFD